MATVNKRYLKNTGLHSNFAKRAKNSDIEEEFDATKIQTYLVKDWEERVEDNPEFWGIGMIYHKLIPDNLTPSKWRELSKHLRGQHKWRSLFEMMRVRRRIARVKYAARIRNELKQLEVEKDNLSKEKDNLSKEKDVLLNEIESYKLGILLRCQSA